MDEIVNGYSRFIARSVRVIHDVCLGLWLRSKVEEWLVILQSSVYNQRRL